ncbi:MAG: hypothetical protein GF309_05110 [Candidatus Lokiarchaeota archaeon]|nr:hypothetical protein [Candidatus Lokiarchaeota archaeon]
MKINIEKDGIVAEGFMQAKRPREDYDVKSKDGEDVEFLSFVLCKADRSDRILAGKDSEQVLAMIESDDDIDLQLLGKKIDTKRTVILDNDNTIVHNYRVLDTLEKDGEKKTREHERTLGNVHSEIPLKILSKSLTKKEAFEQYLLEKSYYITHTNAHAYNFLHDLAEELEDDKMYWVRAFNPETKSPSPLVLRNGGKKYSASFIEGKQMGDEYLVMLHLVEREFKIPEREDDEM